MWLSNFTIIGPDKLMEGASLRIEDGLIAEIVPRAVPSGVDGEGRLLCPGFIDMHGDMIEVEVEPRAGVDFPKQNAIAHLDARMAACGFTANGARARTRKGSYALCMKQGHIAGSITAFTRGSISTFRTQKLCFQTSSLAGWSISSP